MNQILKRKDCFQKFRNVGRSIINILLIRSVLFYLFIIWYLRIHQS